MTELVIIDTQTGASRRVSWNAQPTTIGCAIDAGVVLPGSGIAEQHCRLEPTSDGGIRIVDLGSPFGTRRNDQLVGRVKLGLGDVVQIGRFRLVIAGDDAAPSEPPPVAASSSTPAEPPVVPPPAAAVLPAAATPPDPVATVPVAPSPAPVAPTPARSTVTKRAAPVVANRSEKSGPVEDSRPEAVDRSERRQDLGASTAVDSDGPRRRRASTSSAGVTAAVLVVAFIIVGGIVAMSAKFGEKDASPAGLDSAVPPIQSAIEQCRFDSARMLLGTAQRQYENNPRLNALAQQLSGRQAQYDLALSQIDDARQLADRGRPQTAAQQLQSIADSFASLAPIRVRAESLMEKYAQLEQSVSVNPHADLSNPRDLKKWLPEVTQLTRTRVDPDGTELPGDFSGALRILQLLQPADVREGRQIDEAYERLQKDARVAAERVFAMANRHIEAGRVLIAQNVLHRREIGVFEGTDVWYEMLELADVVEGKIDELDMPDDARPEPKRTHSRPRPKPWQSRADRARAAATSGPVFPTRRSAAESGEVVETTTPTRDPVHEEVASSEPTTSLTAEQLLAQAEAALGEMDFVTASSLLDRALSGATNSTLRHRISRQVERAQRPLWLASTFARTMHEKPPSKAPTVELRDGTSGSLVGSDGTRLKLAISEGERTVSASEIAPASLLKLTRRLRLEPDDHLNRAWLALVLGDDKTFLASLDQVADDVTLQASVYSALAFQKGLDDIPERGFFRVDKKWMTFSERQQHELEVGLMSAFEMFARADKAEEGLALVEELYDRYPSEVIDEVEVHLVLLSKRWVDVPERSKLAGLMKTREELEAARAHALELIFDREKYFYPYRPPAVSSKKAREYTEVQLEVDRRVAAVRTLWGREHSPYEGPSVSISSKTADLVDTMHRIRDLLYYLAGDIDIYEGGRDAYLLPRGQRQVNLRNYAMDLDERERLDQDVKVRKYHATVQIDRPGELTQIKITNDYREMLGRCRLGFNEKIHAAARWHADWMGRTGVFGHLEEGEPERRSPFDRMKKEGYTQGGGGENCAISGSPSQAHYGWIHSSGHHRNLLWEGHTEMATGNAGRYWVQNFGGGSEFAGNLTD